MCILSTKLETNTLSPIGEATYAVCDQIVLMPSGGQARELRNAGLKHPHTHSDEMNTTRHRVRIESKESCRGRVTQHSKSEAGMLSLSESLGKKICKLLSSLDTKHLDLLLFNMLTDEEVTHCNVLGLFVISRVLSKAQGAFVVAKKGSLVNMKTDRIK